MNDQKTALVIPTTHWDRDWYWPFERFRVKLIELFQEVITIWQDCPEYRFAIDGQTIPVEDYLEAGLRIVRFLRKWVERTG